MAVPAQQRDLLQVLQGTFGLQNFRGLQGEVITRILAGQDVLALMPTGAGKSLCYQLPALLLDGLTLVISPLIALMRDQERRLAALGIAGRALSSAQTPAERSVVACALAAGQLKVLLVSPERLLAPGFMPWLARLCAAHPVRLLVVDEAHCIAEWGAAFRPVYRRLGEVRTRFPEAPVLALTASADAQVQAEVRRILGMPAGSVLAASFDRPELYYRVLQTSAPARLALAFLQRHHAADSAIFYCRRRWQTAVLARFLRAHGVPACAYHAGLGSPLRHQAEQWFLQTPAAVMVATIAFGMGIDKADVRLVVHIGASTSLAAYYQESGRAGRDGARADALLLLPPGAAIADPEAGAPASAGQDMNAYAQAPGCRRQVLLAAFDQHYAPPCGACDHCCPDWHPPPDLPETRLSWVPPAREGRPRRPQLQRDR